MQWERVERGVTRGMRFPIAVSLRYRADESGWHDGESVNISGSGVLFRAAWPLAVETPVEMSFALPVAVPDRATVRIVCRGRVVRVTAPEPPDDRAIVAASIAKYQFVREQGAQQEELPTR